MCYGRCLEVRSTITPASVRRARNVRAISSASSVSPCRQTVSIRVGICLPDAEMIAPASGITGTVLKFDAGYTIG